MASEEGVVPQRPELLCLARGVLKREREAEVQVPLRY
jgi:hypothetical protein